MKDFYSTLLKSLRHPVFHDGEWQLLEIKPAWEGDFSFQNIVAHQWTLEGNRRIIVANLSDQPAQSHIKTTIPELAGKEWLLRDLFHDTQYRWSGDEMLNQGLYVELEGYGYHLFDAVSL